jgi:ribosomal protein L37AE/L43A
MRKPVTENPSRPTCDHLFIHLPLAPFKWRCVKCGAKVWRRNYRNIVYSSTAAKEQEQTETETENDG